MAGTTLPGEANNSYFDVPATGGSGVNATFNVYRDSNGDVYDINVATGGYGYNLGETLTIDGGDVGGSSGTDDVIFPVGGVGRSTTNTGNYNNFFGRYAGRYNTTGFNNNFLGNCAGYCNTQGCNNNFLGNDAGRDNTTGRHNNFSGNNAGQYYTTGYNNNFFGHNAGRGRRGIITSTSPPE